MTIRISSLEELRKWARDKDVYDLVAYKYSNQDKGIGAYSSNLGSMLSTISASTEHGYGLSNGVFVEILY